MTNNDNRTFAVMAKVVGGFCNLQCEYCYYTEKTKSLPRTHRRMRGDVLEAYVRENLRINGKNAVVEFAWHGGEPLLAGIDFFREAVALEKQYGKDRQMVNNLQTNATLLNEAWCRFFAKHRFQLGISIDGPEEFHNTYRKGPDGGTFKDVMAGIELLRKHRIRFNTLTTVNAVNEKHPVVVYDFLRQYTDFMQFLPVVERKPDFVESEDGQDLSMPPGINSALMQRNMTPFSVTPEGYGRFLVNVFDRWKELDYKKKHVQLFEVTAGNMRGKPSSLCVHNPLCGHGASIETDGGVYSCDHYTFPEYQLGNILETPLDEIMEKNRAFGMHKTYGLPKECFDCPYIKLCFGGCPKDRILFSQDGRRGKNYLCEGYKLFFRHFLKSMENHRGGTITVGEVLDKPEGPNRREASQ